MNEEAEELIFSEQYRLIKADLLDQLERNGTNGKYYEDMICDYMGLWVTKSMLIADIQFRGVTVRYENGGGQSGYKKNDSVDALVKVNAQMLKILAALELKPSQNTGGEDDEM